MSSINSNNPTDDTPVAEEAMCFALILALACSYLSQQTGQSPSFWNNKLAVEAGRMRDADNVSLERLEKMLDISKKFQTMAALLLTIQKIENLEQWLDRDDTSII